MLVLIEISVEFDDECCNLIITCNRNITMMKVYYIFSDC